MPVNFYLKKAEPTTGLSLIYLKFKYKKQVLVFTFGETIDPKNWNPKKQRVKSNGQTTADGRHSLNDLLDNLQEIVEKAYRDELKNGTPPPSTLKAHLTAFFKLNTPAEDRQRESGLFALIGRFIAGEIDNAGKPKSPATIAKYITVRKHLRGYEATTGQRLGFDTITVDFRRRFMDFLSKPHPLIDEDGKQEQSPGLSQNSAAKVIVNIKTFLNEAIDQGLTVNVEFKKKAFRVSTVATDAVYLTDAELRQFFAFDLSAKKPLERVRDLFIFAGYTGLRFSDASSIRPEHLIEVGGRPMLQIITKKTGELVLIPCHSVVLQVFDKYQDRPNRLPRAISSQRFNDFLKEAAKEAGLNVRGRLSTNPTAELWECLSSHTARRSYATNMYLAGVPVHDIMKTTGHRKESSFLAYLKLSNRDAAERIAEHMDLREGKKLKAV